MVLRIHSAGTPGIFRFLKAHAGNSVRKKTRFKNLTSDFNTAYKQYEQLKETTAGLTSKDEAVTEQWEQLQKTIHALWEQYNQIKREMYKVGTAIEESAAKKSAASGKLVSKFKRWSYLLYILGTLMILTGRLRNVMKATGAGS